MSIRWSHGFFRIWILLTVLWIAAATWFQMGGEAPPQFDPSQPYEEVVPPPPGYKPVPQFDPDEYLARKSAEAAKLMALKAGWILVPPVLVLILGVGIAWTVRGFKPPSATPQSK